MTKEILPVPAMAPQPIDASADPKRNAYSFYCRALQWQHNYSVCLNHIANRAKGPLGVLYARCSDAIGGGSCPAIEMKQKEKDKGQAMFFRERVVPGDIIEKASKYFKGTRQEPTDSIKVRVAPIADAMVASGYAEAINRHIAESKKEPTPALLLVVKDGETPLQAARRTLLEQTKGLT